MEDHHLIVMENKIVADLHFFRGLATKNMTVKNWTINNNLRKQLSRHDNNTLNIIAAQKLR